MVTVLYIVDHSAMSALNLDLVLFKCQILYNIDQP